MKRVFLIGFLTLLVTAGIEVSGQFPQGERMRRRVDQSIRANDPARPAEEEGRLPEPRPAIMNVDVQMVLSKAEHKTFAEARAAEARKIVDGEPLWLYIKFKSRLGDYVVTTRDTVDPEKFRYTLFVEIAPRGDITALHQYAVRFAKEDLAVNEIKINLAPGLFGPNRSVPIFLMTSGNAKSGVWNNEFRLTNNTSVPRAMTDNLATASLMLDFASGTAKYRKMDSDYLSIVLRGSTDLTKLPIPGTFYNDALSEKITAKLAAESITPLKIYFSGDDWQEAAASLPSMSRTRRLYATFIYRRNNGCFYGIAEVIESYDFVQTKFGEPEVRLQKDLPVPCTEI